MNQLKLIKAIVVVVTFLLVFGSLLLLTVIYKKAQPKPDTFTEISLDQPSGSFIASVTETNGSLAILIKDGGIKDRIILFNPQTMKKSGIINL